MKGLKKQQLESTIKEALALYDANFSMREVAKKVKKSHQWVWLQVKNREAMKQGKPKS